MTMLMLKTTMVQYCSCHTNDSLQITTVSIMSIVITITIVMVCATEVSV